MTISALAREQYTDPGPGTDVLAQDVLLGIRDLHTYFSTDEGFVKAVNGVSFDIKKESVFGVVGESGCDVMQGYLYSKPLLEEEALAKLA